MDRTASSYRTREHFAAIQQKREPNASIFQVLPAMRTLNRLDGCLNAAG